MLGLSVLRTIGLTILSFYYNIYLLYSYNHICYSYDKKEYELHCFNYILTNSLIIVPVSYFFLDYYYLSNELDLYINKCLFFLGIQDISFCFIEKELKKMNLSIQYLKTPSTVLYSVDIKLLFYYIIPLFIYSVKTSLNCISLYFIITMFFLKIHRYTIFKLIYNCFSFIYFSLFPTSKSSLNKILKYDSDTEIESDEEKMSREIQLTEAPFSFSMQRKKSLETMVDLEKNKEQESQNSSPTKSESDNESFIFIE